VEEKRQESEGRGQGGYLDEDLGLLSDVAIGEQDDAGHVDVGGTEDLDHNGPLLFGIGLVELSLGEGRHDHPEKIVQHHRHQGGDQQETDGCGREGSEKACVCVWGGGGPQ
jgi:hypothetical protein